MSYYKYDKEKAEKIKEIDEKISKEQQQIFDILLKISQSFSDEHCTKEKRNELFCQVDTLKQNIKDYNEKLKEIKLGKYYEKSDKVVENKNDVELVKSYDEVKKVEKESEEFVDIVQKLEDTLKQSENIKLKNDNDKRNDELTFSKRKKARTQLVVVEDDDSLSGKIKDFFNKLRNIIKK